MFSSDPSAKIIHMRHMKVGLYKALWDVEACYEYDPEANVWIATSEDVPEMVLEGVDLDELKERVKFAISEIL